MPKQSNPTDDERLAHAQDRYNRIMEKIRPFVPPRREQRPIAAEDWRRGEDLPDETKERFRIEFPLTTFRALGRDYSSTRTTR